MEGSATLISAITALAAVLVAPLIQFYVARLEIRVLTHSNNRQQWINSVRDELARFLSLIAEIGHCNTEAASSPQQAREFYGDILQSHFKLMLLMNPTEADHAALLQQLFLTMADVTKADGLPVAQFSERLAQHSHKVIQLSQPILKREWERVKKIA